MARRRWSAIVAVRRRPG